MPGEGTKAAYLLRRDDFVRYEDVREPTLTKGLGLPDRGDADAADGPTGRELLVRDGRRAVRAYVGTKSSVAPLEEGAHRLDVPLYRGEVGHQGGGVELLYWCANRLKNGAFHQAPGSARVAQRRGSVHQRSYSGSTGLRRARAERKGAPELCNELIARALGVFRWQVPNALVIVAPIARDYHNST